MPIFVGIIDHKRPQLAAIPISQLLLMKMITSSIYILYTVPSADCTSIFIKPYAKTTTKPATRTLIETTAKPTSKRPWTDRLTCFTCNARNMDECMRTGYYKECEFNEQSCMIEARHRGGRTENVSHR